MPNLQIAQKAVAMEACKLLHQSGELDDHFMPISMYVCVYLCSVFNIYQLTYYIVSTYFKKILFSGKETIKYAEELDPWPPEKFRTTGRPGTTKRRQTYEKEVKNIYLFC